MPSSREQDARREPPGPRADNRDPWTARLRDHPITLPPIELLAARGIMPAAFDEHLAKDSPARPRTDRFPEIPILPQRRDLEWVRGFRRLVAERSDAIARSVREELGKDEFETLTSEIVPLLSACRWLERHARRILRPRRTPGGGIWQLGQSHRVVRAPLGRIAIIATWNYPVQLLGVQLAQALVAGNAVTVKPSERSPRTQGMLLDLALEAGMPDARLARVASDRPEGERLLREHPFDHVIFTGSTRVGRTVASVLSERLIPSTLELSGSDSAIVLADADPALAARSILFALRLNGGQTCMAPRRVLVERALAERFLDALRGELVRPAPMTPATPAELDLALSCARDAARAGGLWLSGESDQPPFIVAACPVDTPLFRGEHFGPALAITPVASLDEALRLHAGIDRKLATSIFTRDPSQARAIAASLGSTVVTINDCVIPTGHPGLSLGGLGPSGWGLSRGEAGLLAMTRPVFVSVTGRFVRTPTAPPGAKARASVTRLVRRLYT